YAFCSYGPLIEVLRTEGPGCSPLSRVAGMVEVALGGMPEKFRSSRWQAAVPNTARAVILSATKNLKRPARRSGKREHIQHPAFGGCLGKILHRVDEPERRTRVSDIQTAGHDSPGPAPHPGQHGHIFLAVGAAIHDRLPHDPRAHLELPQLGPVSRIKRLEPAVHRAVEHDVPG